MKEIFLLNNISCFLERDVTFLQPPEGILTLFFPMNTDYETIVDFLNVMYPDVFYKIYKSNEIVYLVRDDIWGKLNQGLLSLFHGFVSLGKIFRLSFPEPEEGKEADDRYILLESSIPARDFEDDDPCVRLTQQFNVDYIFDILEFINKPIYEEYFKALLDILIDDSRSASSKLGLVSESFVKNVVLKVIPESLKGCKGIVEIRKHLKTKMKWINLVNLINRIKEKVDMSEERKEILDTLNYGFHLLRKLRNRAQHPDTPFNELQTETMLYMLIFLQGEIRVFVHND